MVESDLTLAEARQEALDLETRLIALYPQSQWELSNDGAFPDECETARGEAGAFFYRAVYRTDGDIQSEADARSAASYLSSIGFTDFEERSFAKDNHQFTAVGPTGIEIYLVAERDSFGITLESACVEADYMAEMKTYGDILEASQSPKPSAKGH